MTIEEVLSAEEIGALDGVCRQAFECLATLTSMEPASVPASSPLPWAARIRYEGGAWGAVLIRCSAPFAFTFTQNFMGVGRPEDLDADVRDALGELANTIGGNYKALLPPTTQLSIPEVGAAEDIVPSSTDRLLAEITYDSEIGTCSVSLLAPEMEAAGVQRS